jgi:hypothetical protein
MTGASFLREYTEYKLPVGGTATQETVHDRWSVVSADETVDVPAGHFEHVVHLQKISSSTKDYWYARGVGKLKETGGQTEELENYSIQSGAEP